MGTTRIGDVVKSGPATSFRLEADWDNQESGNNRSHLRVWLRAANGPGGTTGSRFNNLGRQIARVNGSEIGRYEANPFLPSGFPNGAQRWHVSFGRWYGHDAAGYGPSLGLEMRLEYGNINESHWGSIGAPPRIPKPPNTPSTPGVDRITPTSARVTYTAPGTNGAAITGGQAQWRNAAGTVVHTSSWSGASSGSATWSGATPGTAYSVRVRFNSSAGYSSYSSARSFTTLVSSGPGISVAPTLSGLGATVTLTPPGGISGVTLWEFQSRLGGAGTVSTAQQTSPKRTYSQLTPGAQYQWRGRARIGDTYWSPYTDWLPVNQPNPNLGAGSYYDGSFPNDGDNSYSWAGAPHASISRITSPVPEGWGVVNETYAKLYRVTGGRDDAYSANLIFHRDTTIAGQWTAGQSSNIALQSDVNGGAIYSAGMWVRPTRGTRLSLHVFWFTAAGASVGSITSGDAVECPGEEWTRVTYTGMQAPSNAAKAYIALRTVSGTGFQNQQGGDSIRLDSALMVLGSELPPYFSGATPDTPEFEYEWTGEAHRSVSLRRQLEGFVIDPLADPDCDAIPAPPMPPEIPSDCIEEIGTWRRYGFQIGDLDIPRFGASIPTMLLQTGGNAERQVRIRFYPNVDGLPADQVDTTRWDGEMILSYIPANSRITIDGVSQRVWADFQTGPRRDADSLLYGSNGRPAVWPELTCGYGYLVTLDLPTSTVPGNLTWGLLLTQRV